MVVAPHTTGPRALLSALARRLRDDPALRRRILRPTVAVVAALAGLTLVTMGPAAIVLLWHKHDERQEAAVAATAHYLGSPVRDGSVTFVVHEVRCGSDRDDTSRRRCEVTVGARNDGSDTVNVPASAQWLRVAEGARHQPVNRDDQLLGELAPGRSATAVLVYQLPRHATVTHVELRAGPYSPGTPVDVAGQSLPLLD